MTRQAQLSLIPHLFQLAAEEPHLPPAGARRFPTSRTPASSSVHTSGTVRRAQWPGLWMDRRGWAAVEPGAHLYAEEVREDDRLHAQDVGGRGLQIPAP